MTSSKILSVAQWPTRKDHKRFWYDRDHDITERGVPLTRRVLPCVAGSAELLSKDAAGDPIPCAGVPGPRGRGRQGSNWGDRRVGCASVPGGSEGQNWPPYGAAVQPSAPEQVCSG